MVFVRLVKLEVSEVLDALILSKRWLGSVQIFSALFFSLCSGLNSFCCRIFRFSAVLIYNTIFGYTHSMNFLSKTNLFLVSKNVLFLNLPFLSLWSQFALKAINMLIIALLFASSNILVTSVSVSGHSFFFWLGVTFFAYLCRSLWKASQWKCYVVAYFFSYCFLLCKHLN